MAEAGHAATRVFIDQNGALNLNGAPIYDVNGNDWTVTSVERLERFSPQPTDTYASTMTIDVTYTSHIIAASHTTSATSTLTPSAHGTAGDLMIILTEADSSGTVTVTFASTFHSSGTQASTASTFSSIVFQSDGTRWVEVCRTTALT